MCPCQNGMACFPACINFATIHLFSLYFQNGLGGVNTDLLSWRLYCSSLLIQQTTKALLYLLTWLLMQQSIVPFKTHLQGQGMAIPRVIVHLSCIEIQETQIGSDRALNFLWSVELKLLQRKCSRSLMSLGIQKKRSHLWNIFKPM